MSIQHTPCPVSPHSPPPPLSLSYTYTVMSASLTLFVYSHTIILCTVVYLSVSHSSPTIVRCLYVVLCMFWYSKHESCAVIIKRDYQNLHIKHCIIIVTLLRDLRFPISSTYRIRCKIRVFKIS